MFAIGSTHRRAGRGPLAADWGVKLRHADFFTGIGGFSLGFEFAGIETALMCEYDDAATEVLDTHWPDIRKFGDIREFDGRPYRGQIDIVTGGFPCFPAGTQILTSDGFRDIAEIAVGDRVLTHAGNWKPVVATMTRDDAPLLRLTDADGTTILTTPEHPFYSFDGERFDWVEAKDMLGRSWSRPLAVASVPDELHKPGVAEAFGFFLATRFSPGRRVVHTGIFPWLDAPWRLLLMIDLLGVGFDYAIAWSRSHARLRVHDADLSGLLRGLRAGSPPPWLLGLPSDLAQRVLDGFLLAAAEHAGRHGLGDGKGRVATRRFPTSFRSLLTAIRELVVRAGLPYRVTVVPVGETGLWHRLVVDPASDAEHTVTLDPATGVSFLITEIVSVESLSSATVYNLEVRDDNSYVADGIAVHNCQDLSVSGSERRGLAGERSGLFRELVRVVHDIAPKYVVWENVPGLLSSWSGSPEAAGDDGEWQEDSDILTVMEAFGEIGFHGGYRVLDSRYFGVPQSRRRVFGVVSRGRAGWRRAAAILLDDPERGDGPQASDQAGSSCLAGVGSCLKASGGYKADLTHETYVVEGDPPAGFDRDGEWLVGGAIERLETARSGRDVLLGVAVRGASPDAAGAGAAAGLPRRLDDPRLDEKLLRRLDARREKQLGNAVTVNVAEFIGHRIVQLERFLRAHPWLDRDDEDGQAFAAAEGSANAEPGVAA